jgi:hypothetical protein
LLFVGSLTQRKGLATVFKIIEKKYGKVMDTPTDTFTINMGVVNIIFNTNNV